MNRLDERLSRLFPGLSPRERVRLIAGRLFEGERPERRLLAVPEPQYDEVRYLVGLLQGANSSLALIALGQYQEACALRLNLCWLYTLQLWALNAWGALEALDALPEIVVKCDGPRRRARRTEAAWTLVLPDSQRAEAERVTRALAAVRGELRQGPLAIHVENGAMRVRRDEAERSPADEMLRLTLSAIASGVERLWGERLALEEVVAGCVEEVGGEVFHPVAREHLAATREVLLEVHREVERFVGPVALSGANERAVATYRELLSQRQSPH